MPRSMAWRRKKQHSGRASKRRPRTPTPPVTNQIIRGGVGVYESPKSISKSLFYKLVANATVLMFGAKLTVREPLTLAVGENELFFLKNVCLGKSARHRWPGVARVGPDMMLLLCC
jgi:hypothetical protein